MATRRATLRRNLHTIVPPLPHKPNAFDKRIALANLTVQVVLAIFAGYTLAFVVLPIWETAVLREQASKLEIDVRNLKTEIQAATNDLAVARRQLYETRREIVLSDLPAMFMRCPTKQYDGKETSWRHLTEPGGGFTVCLQGHIRSRLADFEGRGASHSITRSPIDKQCLLDRAAFVGKDLDRDLADVLRKYRNTPQLDEALLMFGRNIVSAALSLGFYVSTAEEPTKCRK